MKYISNNAEELVSKYKEILSPYIKHCEDVAEKKDYLANEASLCLVDDATILQTVREMVDKKKTNSLHYIIDIGIGGSNLGTKAVYDALYGSTEMFHPERFPKMIFLDTTDPEYISSFQMFVETHITSPDQFLVTVVSKSGGTTETAVNGEITIEILKKKFPNWKDRFVVISDKNSLLWKGAEKLGMSTLAIPQRVGGRYSIFSPVGLFPLALCGIDIKSLLQGGSAMRQDCLTPMSEGKNSAALSAAFLYEELKKGMAIHDNFYFHSELESLGKWYRQLMGESIGKNSKGLTPTVSMGSVDLHSVAQLYLGGPKDKVTTFVYTNSFLEVSIPSSNTLSHIKSIEGRKVGDIMNAIQHGTIAAYTNSNLPLIQIELDGINLKEIGAYMQFKMMEIMYLAKLMEVNAFDQPEVELYKEETRKILAAK